MDLYLHIKKRREQLSMSQQELADALGYKDRSTIAKIESGINDIPQSKISAFAKALQTTPASLMGWEELASHPMPANLRPLRKVHHVPRIGRIACGSPVLAEENIQGQVLLPDGVKADFALDCVGDSMMDACIHDGDTVFIRVQPEVENGEIAAVLIGEEATLKRVYRNGSVLTLMPANTAYMPLSYTKDELDCVRIIGKATAVLKIL